MKTVDRADAAALADPRLQPMVELRRVLPVTNPEAERQLIDQLKRKAEADGKED